MISGIKSIKNVGKYEQFDSAERFEKYDDIWIQWCGKNLH